LTNTRILIPADTTVLVNAVVTSLITAQAMNDLNAVFVTASHQFHCYKLLNVDVPSWTLPRPLKALETGYKD
jgi:hypothetical protein